MVKMVVEGLQLLPINFVTAGVIDTRCLLQLQLGAI